MRYLFWNTAKEQVDDEIVSLIVEYQADIVGLAEYRGNIAFILDELLKYNVEMEIFPSILDQTDKICIISKIPKHKVSIHRTYKNYSIYTIPHKRLGMHIIAFVHLPAKNSGSDHLNLYSIQKLKDDLTEILNDEQDEQEIIVVGDFNLNPFDTNMVSLLGMNAISSRREVLTKSGKRSELLFYNPMWNLLGDVLLPEGTYYYKQATPENNFWHMLDQVIISKGVIDFWDDTKLKIVTKIQGKDLHNKNGKPKVSDHFPLYFEV